MKPSDLPRSREPLTYKQIQARMLAIVIGIALVVALLLPWLAQ